jgi:hypothetical protein
MGVWTVVPMRIAEVRFRRHVAAVVVAAGAAIAALGLPAAALAGLQHEFAPFAECPVNVAGVQTCVRSTVTSGEFKLGSKTVAINKTIVLQGGVTASGTLVPPSNGETLSNTPLTVPGGLVGIEGLGGEVAAAAQLAGTASLNTVNFLARKGAAATLPLKVKLENPLLGESCYIGSDSEPIELGLTTGRTDPPEPNQPIEGAQGTARSLLEPIVTFNGTSLVDNSFAVPGANDCLGLLGLVIDPLVDVEAGLPAAAGHNTAIMDGSLQLSRAAEVKAQLALPEIGRCVRAERREKTYEGNYLNRGCTEESLGEAKYVWHSGPSSSRRFTGSGKSTTLESLGGAKVSCKHSAMAGEYTSAKTASATLTLTGCEQSSNNGSCQSGTSAGEIVSSPLTGTLGLIEDQVTKTSSHVTAGIVLTGTPSLLSAECAGAKERLVVGGAVIAPLASVEKMESSFSLSYDASAGRQLPESFEEAPQQTLTATMGSGSEQAGLTMTMKIKNEEHLEIKAENGLVYY